METTDPDERDVEEELRQMHLRMIAEEDQWQATWGPGPAPKNNPDLRPLVHHFDNILLVAARILSVGVALSPVSVQQLRNALHLYDEGQRFEREEITAEELDQVTAWLVGEPEGVNDGRA